MKMEMCLEQRKFLKEQHQIQMLYIEQHKFLKDWKISNNNKILCYNYIIYIIINFFQIWKNIYIVIILHLVLVFVNNIIVMILIPIIVALCNYYSKDFKRRQKWGEQFYPQEYLAILEAQEEEELIKKIVLEKKYYIHEYKII